MIVDLYLVEASKLWWGLLELESCFVNKGEMKLIQGIIGIDHMYALTQPVNI